MVLQQFHQSVAVGGIDIQICADIIQVHQLLPVFVAEHSHEGFVEMKEAAVRRGDEYALLHIFDQRPVLFFGAPPLGDILQHVNDPQGLSIRIVKLRI